MTKNFPLMRIVSQAFLVNPGKLFILDCVHLEVKIKAKCFQLAKVR